MSWAVVIGGMTLASAPLFPALLQRLHRGIDEGLNALASRNERDEKLMGGDSTFDYQGNAIALLGQIRHLAGYPGYYLLIVLFLLVRSWSRAGRRARGALSARSLGRQDHCPMPAACGLRPLAPSCVPFRPHQTTYKVVKEVFDLTVISAAFVRGGALGAAPAAPDAVPAPSLDAAAVKPKPDEGGGTGSSAFDPLVFGENFIYLSVGACFFSTVHGSNVDKMLSLESLLKEMHPVVAELMKIGARGAGDLRSCGSRSGLLPPAPAAISKSE